MFPTAVVLEGKFISTFTLDHLDNTKARESMGIDGASSFKGEDMVDDQDAKVRLLSPAMEDRMQTNTIPTTVNKTEDNNSDPTANNTNNANVSQVSESDNLNNSRLSHQQLSFKGADRVITNCADKFSEMVMS